MSKVEALILRLNALFEYLDQEYYINAGGCCRVAAKLAEELEYRGIEFKVGFAYDTPEEAKEMKAVNIEKLVLEDTYLEEYPSPEHFSILIGNTIVNNIEDDFIEEHYVFCNLSSLDLYRLYELGYWNPTYNTAKTIYVDKFIDTVFRQYDNNDL